MAQDQVQLLWTWILPRAEEGLQRAGDEGPIPNRILDAEGRCLSLEFPPAHEGARPLAIVNVYLPRGYPGSRDRREQERFDFKMAYSRAVGLRCASLQARGARVLLVGDMNVARDCGLVVL